MSLLLQELFSAKVEASGSRIHEDERVSDRILDWENPWPMVGDELGVTECGENIRNLYGC